MMNVKLVARPLITLDKERKVKPVERDGVVYLMITKCRFIGRGKTLDEAIENANLNTFYTGYRVYVVGGK